MIQDCPAPRDFVVREPDGDERATWWGRAVAPYAEYQTETDRPIPVFLAEPSAG